MVQAGRPGWRDRATAIPEWSELYKLLRYFALVTRFRARTTGDYLKPDAGPKNEAPVDYDEIEPWTRVSPHDYERNVREMIDLARGRGMRVVLLDNELWPESPYRAVLGRIARDENVPLVDSVQLIVDAKKRIAQDLEARFNLRPSLTPLSPASRDRQTVVFRVYQGSYAVAHTLSIVGSDPQLGNAVPNTAAMHDDGTGGDERAGDRVWSYQASFPVGSHLRYAYTNSGGQGRWEGLDVPHIREIHVEASADGRPLYLPIETFGKIYMQADNWHTDAAGYDLIARAVLRALEP
jgi:hypothetical protein